MINVYTKSVNFCKLCEENEWNMQKLEIYVQGGQKLLDRTKTDLALDNFIIKSV